MIPKWVRLYTDFWIELIVHGTAHFSDGMDWSELASITILFQTTLIPSTCLPVMMTMIWLSMEPLAVVHFRFGSLLLPCQRVQARA